MRTGSDGHASAGGNGAFSNRTPGICLGKGTIAVLLAVYNGARYLEEQLESLRLQTYRNFICLIHDDGSDDGTQKIAEEYCSTHPEQFVYLGSMPTGGAKNHFLYLLREVDADYIMFCDQDDVWMPEKIAVTRQAFSQLEQENSGAPAAVYSDLTVVDENLNVLNPSFYAYAKMNSSRNSLKDLLHQNLAAGCTMMINRPLRRLAISQDVNGLIHMHDWFLITLAAAAGKIAFIDRPLIYYRQHENNTIGVHKQQKLSYRILNNLVHSRHFLKTKKIFLETRKKNAQAVLICMADGQFPEENRAILNDFIKKYSAPMALGLIDYYHWKLAGGYGR